MKYHPAMRGLKKLFRYSGLDIQEVGTLSAHVVKKYVRGEYEDRPLIVDIKISQYSDNIAKVDVCEFSCNHSMYNAAMKLHGLEFTYGDAP